MKKIATLAMAVVIAACSREKATNVKNTTTSAVKNAATKVGDAFDISAPMGTPDTPQEREKQRFDQQWRDLQSFKAQQQRQLQAQQAAAQQASAQAAAQIHVVPRTKGMKETFKGLDANAINAAAVALPITGDLRGPSVLKTQVFLDRAHYSVGSIDGRWGRNSAITVWWWQRAHGLPATGDVDEATFRSIAAAAGAPPAVQSYTVTADDVKGPFVNIPDDVYEKQKLDCLCYSSVKEELGEKFHVDPDFLEVLNPDVKFSDLAAGSTIVVPNVRPPLTADQHDIAKVVISLSGNSFNAFDASGNLIFHAPTTVGNAFDPSPEETVKMIKIVDHPHFHYDPTLYHEVPDSNPDAHLSPGPNSPVGVVWMALSKPHYGIHGTQDPESIGYASSHGCIRLTNWDAAEVEHRISEGVMISFVDTKRSDAPKVAESNR